jgi:uncharacterized protein YkwD
MAEDKHVGSRTALVACGLALLGAALLPGTGHSATGSRTTVTALEAGILSEVNDVRAAHGLRPLKLSTGLTAAARQHTFEMLDDGYFEHESANGAPFWRRVEQFYPQASGFWEVGENLIWCSPSLRAKKAVELWMGSSGHRQNILSPKWKEIGVAAVHSTTSTGEYGGGAVTIITADFGVR